MTNKEKAVLIQEQADALRELLETMPIVESRYGRNRNLTVDGWLVAIRLEMSAYAQEVEND